jgi:hypothetical protein
VLLELQLPGAAAPLRPALGRPLTLGGSQADGLPVPGLPPAALRLEPHAAGLVLSPAAAGLRVGGRPVPPGGRRLLRPGERATFQDLALTLPAAGPAERTRVAAAAILRGAQRDPGAPSGPHVVVLTGPQAGARAALGAGLLVGRARGAGLRLLDAAASRRHARIEPGPLGATAQDLGAKNRLRVNGVPVERGPVLLRPGDLLTVGETDLAYEGPGEPRRAPPARAAPARAGPPRRRRAPGLRSLMAAALLAVSAAALAAISSCG